MNDIEHDQGEVDSDEGSLTLVFTVEGTAVLYEDDEAVWMSDDDDNFLERYGDEYLNAEQDSATVLNYLERMDIIESDEKPNVQIEEEDDSEEEDEED